MNPDNTVEYNSLSWVKAQLDDVLSDAQTSLNEYIENKTNGELENCIEHLQLIYGTLQMVEVYGASMLAEEMQLTTTALLEGNVERAEDAYDVLMRAMLQLPDYLEGIQAGKKDAPITLMPLINDLRAARKEGLLTESVLFSPDLETATLTSTGHDVNTIEPGTLQGEVKRLRTHYQLGLLDFIRNKKERVGLQRIKAVLSAFEKATSNDEVRRMWMVVSALVEGLMKQGIDSNLSIKMLLGTLDRQLKLIVDNGEEDFSGQYSKDLVKNILYYVGLCKVDSQSITAVKEAYHLSDLIPQEASDTAAIGGLNADLFDTVSKGITEDLTKVKDILELFMQSSEQNVEQLEPVSEQLGKIADTYGMLGMGATRQSIMDQRVVMESIVNGDIEIDDQTVLSIASGLLNAESELKDYIDSRAGFVDMVPDSDDQIVPSSEYRQVVHTVVVEGLKNFSEAKEAILSYISGIGDTEQLDIIINRLEEVRGVSMMLPLDRVESQIEKLQNFVRTALLSNQHQVSDSEQDTVADVVTSIEYFFEALSEGRPGVEQGLNAGDEAANKLEAITASYRELEQEDGSIESNETVLAVPTHEEAVVDLAEEVLEEVSIEVELTDELEQDEPETIDTVSQTVFQQSEPQDAQQYLILADDADEEIVEIFIEEAIEVLGELHEFLPQWRADNDNEEALAVVRRSFHTLKGSGRLLGAEMIGEFAWKFENMLNRVIDKKIMVSDAFFDVLDEALTVLPQLIEQLKGNREPVDGLAQLMSAADALAEGRDVALDENDHATTVTGETNVDKDVTGDDVPDGLARSGSEEVSATEVKRKVADFPGLGAIVLGLDDEVVQKKTEEPQETIAGDSDSVEKVTISESHNDAFAEVEESAVDNVASLNSEIEVDDITAMAAEEFVTEGVDPADEVVDVVDIGLVGFERADNVDVPITEKFEADSEVDVVDTDLIGFERADSGEEIIELVDTSDHEFEIVIDENVVNVGEGVLDIDPMLLKIYHDESKGYVEAIRQLINESESKNKPLKADKNLIRAFHTLYGSARTAEVAPIAELSGSAEKYVKVRQESGEDNIPDDVVTVFREIEQSISEMLSKVEEGNLPASNKVLQEKIHKIVQQEIQTQLQQSWQDNSGAKQSDVTDAFSSAASALEDDPNNDNDNDRKSTGLDDEIVIDIVDLSSARANDEFAGTSDNESLEPLVDVSYGEIDNELIDIFLEEADELLENCERTLEDIKSSPNSVENIQQLQRNMHTLKGGARMADLAPVGDLTHNLESLVVMVSSKKIDTDKVLFDLLQESLDTLTIMLVSVKRRQSLMPATNLNERIEMLMRGEVEEKRAVERFDIELSELESDEEEEEELEDIDISHLLPSNNVKEKIEKLSPLTDEPVKIDSNEEEHPHWGERATDVNFKESQEQVRVRSDLLNNLVNYAGEVNIYHARMGKQITDFGFNLSELTQTVVRLKEQLRKLEIETEIQIRSGYEKESDNFDDDFDPLEMDQYSTLQQLTRSLSETAADVDSINGILTDITRDSETLLLQESRVSTDLQEGLMRTRMVRFGGLSSRLRRIVRQVARELGKEVNVDIVGEGSEVDRTVLDRIIAPMEHILRNAVAHGIEMPEVRKAVGKNESGKIIIKVDRQGTDVVINIKDDGAGINANKVRQKAIKQGLITADAELSDHDILQFILQSGFSTADEITQVAGRGVGMDVVDSEIKQLGGVLDIDTVQGKGAEFTVRLPLTLAINQALLVSAGEDVFAIPLASIEGVVRMTGYELQRFYDSSHSLYEFNGIEFELKHLGGLLNGHQPDYSKQLQLFPVLLVRVGDQHFALHVDNMLGRREIVVKPVGMQIGAVRGIAGATILADGRVVLILEMSALVAAESLFKPHVAVEVEAETEAVVDTRKTIMVVDDSITIRKITERMLKRYGLDVVLAKDGIDATSQLQDNIPDLILLDIEMPRMDGFEVANFVRNDDRLKDIPIIMITSRTGAKHKEKAMKIGVNQYLGKPFQEDDLLSNINKILHTSF